MMTLGKNQPNPLKSPRLRMRQRHTPLKIALPVSEGFRFECIDKIRYLEASGNYTFIYFQDGQRLLVCRTLQEMEQRLGASRNFFRIHRSFIINTDYLERYVRGKGGYVVLEGGVDLAVSNSKKQRFLETLEWCFR